MNREEGSGELDKTMGIIAYMTLVGWVIALVQNNNQSGSEEKQFTAFHLRQMLGLMILGFCCWIIQIPLSFIPLIGFPISMLLSLGIFVFWILAVIGAANGSMTELPYIGEPIQKLLGKTLFD